jgi:hypothetical protein
MIHVCSLAHLPVADAGASHIVSLLGDEDHLLRPACVPAEDHF